MAASGNPEKGTPMSYEDDRVIEPQWSDEESANDVFGEEFWSEVKEVCGRAHKLLGDQVVGGFGEAERERVCLDIPKGLLLIAQYVVAREHFQQDWNWMEEALGNKGEEGRGV